MASKRHILLSVMTRIIVCGTIFGVSIVVFIAMWRTRPMPEMRTESAALRRVVVMEARPAEIHRQFEGYGTALAMDTSDVPARVSAIVVQLPDNIQPGFPVTRGQLLVKLDRSDFERRVDIATNNIEDFDAQLARLDIEQASWEERVNIAMEEVELIKFEYERVQKAQQRDAAKIREVEIAKLAWLRSQRNLVNAQEEADKIPTTRKRLEAQRGAQVASLKLANLNLDRCEVFSPIDGVIQFVDVEEGENVTSGQRIARVVNLQRIEVPIQVPASSRPFLALGDEVLLESAGNSRQTWIAIVSRIAPEDDIETRSMKVYVELTQSEENSGSLAPGKFVRASIRSAKPAPRWIVPRRAMRNDQILLIQDGRIVSRRIDVEFQVQGEFPQFGLPDDLWLVLDEKSSLPPNSFVVVTPSRTLMEGLSVEPVLAISRPSLEHSSQEIVK